MTNRSTFAFDTFVSHSGRDKPRVRAIVDQWRGLGLRVFFDEDDIPVGANLLPAIEDGLRKSRYIVLFVSRNSMASKWVAVEMATSFYTELDSETRRLVPVFLEPTERDSIPAVIRGKVFADLCTGDAQQLRKNYHKLLRDLGVDKRPLPDPPDFLDPAAQSDPAHASNTLDGSHIPGQPSTAIGADIARMELVFDGSLDTVSEQESRQVLRQIEKMLELGPVTLRRRKHGSVVLEIELSSRDAERLHWALQQGRLAGLGVRSGRIVAQSENASANSFAETSEPREFTGSSSAASMTESIQLIHEARRGNRDALDVLFERYYERVHRIARIRMGARLRGLLDSYELVQDTFLVASRKIEGFEPRDDASIIQWLARIAEHQIHDAAERLSAGSKRGPDRELKADASRRRADDSTVDLQLPEREPSAIIADREQERFDACVAELPEEYRELVLLRDYGEASWEQICERLGTSNVHAMQERYRRARIKLAELYKRRLSS